MENQLVPKLCLGTHGGELCFASALSIRKLWHLKHLDRRDGAAGRPDGLDASQRVSFLRRNQGRSTRCSGTAVAWAREVAISCRL